MSKQTLQEITERIEERSRATRAGYMEKIRIMREAGPSRDAMSCGNLAHAIAACPDSEKQKLTADENVANIGIVSAYNDMLSAHAPYHEMLDVVKKAVITHGGVAQMAGGTPAMCDGVTQGQPGMELSLFSREVIALSTAVALSHNVFDGGMLFGICDKIVPGLLTGALSFGHMPFIFVPAGPMETGISNSEKAEVRQRYASGDASRQELLQSESRAYHSPGTCTFYGTANSNQMMLEMMGLQLPGASFVNPSDPLRAALNDAAARRIVEMATEKEPVGLADIVDARSIVNGIVGLLATGGSTNHTLHIVAIAAAAGYKVTWADFADLSAITPLLARVYPNGLADVNAFEAAGGMPFMLRELLGAELLHDLDRHVAGKGPLSGHVGAPTLKDDAAVWAPVREAPGDDTVVRPADNPFQPTGGLAMLDGKIGEGVMKISAVKPANRRVEAPAMVFEDQEALIAAYKAGKMNKDFVAVVRWQGPTANGMPELHKLTPSLGVLQDKGYKVALVTDGRMSGASGKVPAAIHVMPEAALGGNIARIRDGDPMLVDPENGVLDVLVDKAEFEARTPAERPASPLTYGRDLFQPMRDRVGVAGEGASIFGFHALHESSQ
ncbi:phosphogluconate dehydratase [Yunchengibacter salinarum]|uniref:phosphogluconate dehydratase n=1 Tax=Yunchengibacter salinarum TaxID=3133399 RepID=UPI0035B58AFF